MASPVADAARVVSVSDRLLNRSRLPGDPDILAASGGLLRVLHADQELLGLDPKTAAVRRTVELARNPVGLSGSCNSLGGDAQHLWTCAGSGVALVTPTPLQDVVEVAGGYGGLTSTLRDGRRYLAFISDTLTELGSR